MILNGRHVTLQELSESVARTKRAEFYRSHIKRPTSCLGECLKPEIRAQFEKGAATKFTKVINGLMNSGNPANKAKAQRLFNRYADYNLAQAQKGVANLDSELTKIKKRWNPIALKVDTIADPRRRAAVTNLLDAAQVRYDATGQELVQSRNRLRSLTGLRPAAIRDKPLFFQQPSDLESYRHSQLTARDGSNHQFIAPVWRQAKQHAQGRMWEGNPFAKRFNMRSLGKAREAPEVHGLYAHAKKRVPGLAQLPGGLAVLETGRQADDVLGGWPSLSTAFSHLINGRPAPGAQPVIISHRKPVKALYEHVPHEVQHLNSLGWALRHNQSNRTIKTGPAAIVGWRKPIQLQGSDHDMLMLEFDANAGVKRQLKHWLGYKEHPLNAATVNQALEGSMAGKPGSIPGLPNSIGYFTPGSKFLRGANQQLQGLSNVDKLKEISKMKSLQKQYSPSYFREAFKEYDTIGR
ncbi:MAG: hypothetical protein FWH57_13485 [Oscillospiraceae bacterium]|nr:hypothetical protein [Oscillospiraceae bacterium]